MYGEDPHLALSSCRRPTPPRWSVELASSLDAPMQSWQPPTKLNSAGRSPDLFLWRFWISIKIIWGVPQVSHHLPEQSNILFWGKPALLWWSSDPNGVQIYFLREREGRGRRGLWGAWRWVRAETRTLVRPTQPLTEGNLARTSTPWTSLLTYGACTTSTLC